MKLVLVILVAAVCGCTVQFKSDPASQPAQPARPAVSGLWRSSDSLYPALPSTSWSCVIVAVTPGIDTNGHGMRCDRRLGRL